jgi:murein DD-endopeptidase MepM/ murein hydrolase activator NlpD
MSSNSYFYYDHEACTFVEVQPSKRRWLVQAGVFAGLVLVMTTIGTWVISSNITTPNEIAQRQEIDVLRGELTAANNSLYSFSEQLETLAETDREIYRTVLGTEPISEDEFQVGVGGARNIGFDRFPGPTRDLLRQTSATFDRLERQFALQTRSFEELETLASERQDILRQQPAILPLQNARLTSGFGYRYHPILHTVRMHNGIDFPTPRGSPIYATGDGEVSFVGSKSGYGNVVEVDHPLARRQTRYAHLSRVAVGVRVGTPVRRGQIIAYSGNTGLSTAPHLHYEVRRLSDGQALNPVATFVPGVSASEYQKLLVAAQQETASFD